MSPFPVIVTSRIIPFLVRDSEQNLHLAKGPHPTYITLLSISFRLSWHKFHKNSPLPAGTLHAHHHPQRHAGPEKSVKPTAFFCIGLAFFWVFVSKKYPLDRLKWLVPRLVRTLDKTKDLAFWCPLQKICQHHKATSCGPFCCFCWSLKLKFVQPKHTCMRRQYIYFDWPMNSYVYIWIYIWYINMCIYIHNYILVVHVCDNDPIYIFCKQQKPWCYPTNLLVVRLSKKWCSERKFLLFLCFTFSWLRRLVPRNTIRVIQTNINPRFIDPLQCLFITMILKWEPRLHRHVTWRSIFDPEQPILLRPSSLWDRATVSNRKATGLGTSGKKKTLKKKNTPTWWIHSLKTNIAPENRPFQKDTIVFQPSIFRCYVSFREVSSPDINSKYRINLKWWPFFADTIWIYPHHTRRMPVMTPGVS